TVPTSETPEAYSPIERVCQTVVGVSLAIAAISVFSPSTSWDAAVAHLALPAQYVRMGQITVLEGNTYSGYPHLLHTLYTYAYAGAGETGAQFISWLFAFLGCVFAFSVGRRLGGRVCGLISAAIFATTPIFFDQAGIASLDIAMAAVVLAVVGALLAWHDEKRMGSLLLAAFLVGNACGIRHTGYLVCALLFIGVLVVSKRPKLRTAMSFSALALAGAAPWLLRSWLAVGNPVYPFFQDIFPSDILVNEDFTRLGSHSSRHGAQFYEVLWFPWRIVMAPNRFDGWNASPGGLILILGVPGLFVGGRRAWLLGLYCLAGIVFFFFFQHFARYMLPFFVAMMPVAALAARRLKKLRWLTYGLLTFTFAYGLVLGLGMNHFKIPVAVGLQTRDDYLETRVERYEAFEWANRALNGKGTVLTLDPRIYYLDMPSFKNYEALHPLIESPINEQLQWFSSRNIRYLLYPVEYVENSPIFTTSGLVGMFERWRNNPEVFRPIKHMTVVSRNGIEDIVVYEVFVPLCDDPSVP
ncbi:MAG: glycosyltransferase family 39 protein, partial [Candidatus Hydrogenedentota bacterium]